MGWRHGTRTDWDRKMKIPKKYSYFGIFVFQNSKTIELFRCHWGGPNKVDEKSIRYVFVQAKHVFSQKSKIIDFFGGFPSS